MKLLSREPGRLVFQLRARDRNSLRGILRMGSECRRRPPRITRGPASFMPEDSEEMLREAIGQQMAEVQQGALAWLEDPARCVAGKGGFGLTLSEGEFEAFLQALNNAKMAFWETLGCPDEDSAPLDETRPEVQAFAFALELSNQYIAHILDCVSGDTD
jgi:hypothetical protein